MWIVCDETYAPRVFVSGLTTKCWSQESRSVRAELLIAESQHKTIIPFWIMGDTWPDATPMSTMCAQYIDAHFIVYPQGLELLFRTLGIDHASILVEYIHYSASGIRRYPHVDAFRDERMRRIVGALARKASSVTVSESSSPFC